MITYPSSLLITSHRHQTYLLSINHSASTTSFIKHYPSSSFIIIHQPVEYEHLQGQKRAKEA